MIHSEINLPFCRKEGTLLIFFEFIHFFTNQATPVISVIFSSNTASLDSPSNLLTIILSIEERLPLMIAPFTKIVVTSSSKLGGGEAEERLPLMIDPFTEIVVTSSSKLGVGEVEERIPLMIAPFTEIVVTSSSKLCPRLGGQRVWPMVVICQFTKLRWQWHSACFTRARPSLDWPTRLLDTISSLPQTFSGKTIVHG